MSWRCGAIENGVTFHPDGTIAPCCMIDKDYRKPISELFNDPFADIRTGKPESPCEVCHNAEKNRLDSTEKSFNCTTTDPTDILTCVTQIYVI